VLLPKLHIMRFACLGCAVVAALTGCASSNETAPDRTAEATAGQQLIDLKRAYDLGALSQMRPQGLAEDGGRGKGAAAFSRSLRNRTALPVG
jgi:hypothetical protein